MRPKYPIGIQTFSEIREGGYVYVDKTEQIYRTVSRGKYFFFSRPRRFGKSLTLSVMHDLYRGRRELFTGLWAAANWDWSQPSKPVVWLKFASFSPLGIGLEAAIQAMLDDQAREHQLELPTGTIGQRFRELLRRLSEREGQRVVVLVDEYDRPITDVIEQLPELDHRRTILKAFYSALKDSDPLLELVFITGVSAFARVSIFSDLNNLLYLTLDERAATLVGITERELYDAFSEELRIADRDKLRSWYNGYSWNGRDFVYNPWSVLHYLETGEVENYWFMTGTPTFLVKLLKQQRTYAPPVLEGDKLTLTTLDPAAPALVPLLFQTGYLTIKGPKDPLGFYPLDYPNLEVRESLDRMLLAQYLEIEQSRAVSRSASLIRAFQCGDLDTVRDSINAALASIPYDHWKGQNEHFFHAVTYLLFRLAGVYLQTEVHTARGRADMLVTTTEAIYVFEFKVDRPAAEAFTQISDRGYLEAYADDARPKFQIAACFSSKTKQLEEWTVRQV